ncbi:VCBS domain-containing protein [Cloacibacillus evryensis]|uniref:VCBS domain-containing protein n=1 Tax=Cloacibacillus evryensis TaxID=508460 RepID=UPI003AB818E2
MAKQIVTKAEGEAYRIEADGSKIKLRVGDLIDDGARIITETGASVRFEDEKGVPLEIGENTGTILFSDAGPELSGTLLAAAPQDAPAKKTDAPTPNDAEAQNPLPSDSEGEDDSEAHSFVELPRIKYGSDINLQYARDVNVTDQIEGRASLNPRIKYSYNLSIDQEIQSYKDTRFPFDGGAKPFEPERPTAGDPPAPETDGTKAVTAEDTGITVDPLENFVTPAGVELTVTGAAAQHGTVEILPDGTLKYTPAPDWFGTDVVTCTSTDQSGRTYNSTVEVTVTPVIDTRDDDAGTVRENSAIDTDVTANDLFADHEGAKVVSVTDGKYGTVTINEDGTVKYTPAIDFLAEGETITDQYTYTVQTAAGNLESATVTVTITGTNDAPVVTAITGTATEDTTLTASGNIIADHVTDADKTDTHAIVKVDGDTSKVGTSIDGAYGSITVNADGTYTYTLNNGTNGDGGNNVQKLAKGEHYDEVFSVTVSDGHGGETTQSITITVHGTNDAPTAKDNSGSVVEDTRVSVTDTDGVNTDGNILANDNDIDNGHTLTIAEVEGSAANVGKATNGEYGTVTISENGTYKYDLANYDPRVQALAEGETLTDTFRITTTDEHGATVNETLTITITGTNDAPEISVITGSVTEDVTLTSSGNVITEHVTDLDATDTHTIIKVDGAESKVGQEITGTYGTIVINTDGSYTYTLNNDADNVQKLAEGEHYDEVFSVTVSDGHGGETTQNITITVHGTNDAPTALNNAGSVVEDTRVSVTDTDDVNTDGNILANDDDIDNGHTLTIAEVEGSAANVGTSVDGTYGKVTINADGTYTYELNNDADNVQALRVGQTVTDTFDVVVTDEHDAAVTETLTITITGTNDAPKISVGTGDSDSAALTETNASLTESGTLTLTDIDVKDSVSTVKVDSIVKGGTYAGTLPTDEALKNMLTISNGALTDSDTGGKINWNFNSGSEHFDSLAEGETLTLTYTVKSTDDSGTANDNDIHEITITITGTNSAPTLNNDIVSVIEDNGFTDDNIHDVATSAANIFDNDTDPDTNGKDLWKVNMAQGSSSTATDINTVYTDIKGTYGTLHLKQDGTYTYTLNNNETNVQELGHDATATDSFTIWMQDGNLSQQKETLTINIGGTNDRPTIGVAAGTSDSAAADVIEGNIIPSDNKAEATGTLTFSDIDLGDTVKVTKLALSDADFTISGPQDGLISTRAELYDMLTLTDTTFTTAGETNSNRLTWTFESGDERFNYLKAGETLKLTYKVQAKDDSGIAANDTSDTLDIVITIKGSDSATDSKPSPDTGTVAEDKTLSVTGHSGTLSGANQNLLYNDDSDGYITKFTVNGSDHSTGVKTTIYAADGTTKLGDITIKANGDYTFTPVKNYSGPVPQITYTTSDGKTSTLDITVTPVADKPTWETPAPSTDGTEDAKIAMNLKLPTITDATDLNGAGTGDHPERLGYITLENIGKATVYYNGDNGDTALTATDGKITIAIVDSANNLDTSLHYTGLDISGTNIVTLTQAQFEALTIQQEAESGKNITGLKLSVTSYETNDDGTQLIVDGKPVSATGTKTFNVDVLAVTDATPDVKLGDKDKLSDLAKTDLENAVTDGHIALKNGSGDTVTNGVTITEESGSTHITVAEDSGTLVLDSSFITAKLTTSDLDGSEHYSITITGLEEGTKVNGITAGADGTVTLVKDVVINSGTNLNNLLDGLKITPPENFSGTMAPAITITTWDTDIDSKGDIAPKTDSITLPTISVTPVVDGVDTIAVKQAVGDEDTYIALDIKPSSQDPNETFNVRISDIPKGATIKYGDAEYKCGNDGKLVHVDGTGNPTGIKLEDDKIIINDFDTSKLSILPPKDSNADFVLKVEAQTVERDGIQVSDWADSPTLNLAVTVHSVADPVTVYDTTDKPLTYTETQAEANGIKLGKLIVKTADNTDGSEQVTLTVTNLAPEFTLAGSAVEFKGGEGTGRTWLVTMKQGVDLENTDAYIKTPANFSGEIKFSAQATNTDSTQAGTGTPDSSTGTSAMTDVAITVTPTPEATVNLSGAADEDALQQLSFAIQYQNGDTDETLNAVYIKASDADGTDKNFTIVYRTDGAASISLKDAVSDTGNGVTKETIDGIEYYKIVSADGKGINNIFVKGDAQYSGKGEDNSFDIKYEVNDSHYGDKDTATGAVTETTITDGTYHVTFKPVTDQTTMKAVAAGDINVGDSGEITLSGTTVTVGTGSANSFSVDVTVNAPADTDGSEHFIKLIVDGVPDGVSVNGATYLGDNGAAVGTGRWLLTVDAGKFFDSSHGSFTTKLDFTVDRGNPNIWGLHGEDAVKVTVTAVSQDEMGSMKGGEEESSTGAEFGIKIDFDGPGTALADVPAPGINITKGAGTVEDSGECTLGDFIKAEYQIDSAEPQWPTEYRFSFEINGLPEGTVVSGDAVGGSVTIKAGGGVTVSGFGNQAAMQSVLDNIKVTLPPDYNNNSGGDTADGMNLNVTWKTDGWDLNGGDAPAPATGTINVTPNVTPITDPMEITIVPASGTMDENQPGDVNAFSFTVSVGAGNDGGYGNVLNGGKLFLKLDGAGESGAITYGGTKYTLTDVADGDYSGIAAGKYYVIENVKAGDVLALAYQPADYYSGNIKVTATIVSKETGAANEIAASGNSELTVNPVNSEYKFTVDDAAANENGTANLTISQTGSYDNDGSEKIHSVVLSGVDAEHSDYFIVKYTVDGAVKTAAKVAAGKDADDNQLYEWVLSTDSAGKLPTGITITGLNHYSGTQNLTMMVVTGETALGTGQANSYGFSLTFHPTADGFSDFTPTLTFGKAGEYIDLNLNAMVNDTSGTGSETATVTLKGLGDGASFFIARDTNGDGTADSYVSVTTAYEGGKYTLSGIALNEINDIKILSPKVDKTNVTVDAWTVEPDAQSGYGQSKPISEDTGHFGNKFDITVSAAAPTSGADRLIYGGDAGTYDGGDGTDTLYLANFRETANSAKNDIDFEEAATIKNIEIIDMSDGAHSLTKVTAEAVKNMTDANNKLLIKGGDDDTIALSDGWVKGEDTLEGWRTYTNGGATINVDGGVNVMINGIASMSLMMAMAFAPLAAAAEPAIMPDSLAGCDLSSDFGAAAASGSPAFSLTAEGMIDFSSLTHSSFGTLDMENASAQSLYHVDPYGVYGVTDGSHELTVTGTELDSVSLADSAEAAWGAPELSADGSHYSYTATGDFDHDAATPDETVTLNVSRTIYDDTLAYDAHAMNDGGLGDDTLTFGHEGSTVDFSGGAAAHIANIERFDLGEGDHSLENITAKDVFNMTDARGTLTINGDNADHVTLSDVLDDATDGMWESSPFQSVESGVSYSVYTGSFEGHMVTLKIEDEIIQQLTTHTKG